MRATALPDVITKDELFAYSISIEDPVEIKSITPPDLRDFIIVNGPVQGSRLSVINGQTHRYITYDYVLRPKKMGLLTIGPAIARAGTDYINSNAARITVFRRTARNALQAGILRWEYADFILENPDSFARKVEKNMNFCIEVSKASCYVGEPLTAAYKLYSRAKNELHERQNFSFNGFSVVEMLASDILSRPVASINGKSYNVNILRAAQLYPLQAGEITFEPATLETTVHFVNGDFASQAKDADLLYDDFVNSYLPPNAEVVKDVSLLSKPVKVIIKPLPESGRPDSFDGAVGTFKIDINLAKSPELTGQPGELMLTLSGSGNLQLLTLPGINWPAGIEAFEPRLKETLTTTSVPISGIKTAVYAFNVKTAGDFIIPPVAFSYFDPETAQYQTIETKPLNLSVRKDSTLKLVEQLPVTEVAESSTVTEIFRHRQWIVIFVGLIMFAVLFVVLLRDKKPEPQTLIDENKTLTPITTITSFEDVLKKAADCMANDDCLNFYPALNTGVRSFLGSAFHLEANLIHSHSVGDILEKSGVPEDLVKRIEHLLQQIEWKLYAPFQRDEEIKEMFTSASETIQQVNHFISVTR